MSLKILSLIYFILIYNLSITVMTILPLCLLRTCSELLDQTNRNHPHSVNTFPVRAFSYGQELE